MRKMSMMVLLLLGSVLAAAPASAQWVYKEGVNDGSDVKWATARIQSGTTTIGVKCWSNKDVHLLIVTSQPAAGRKVGEKISLKVRIDDEDQGILSTGETADLGGFLSYIRPRSEDILGKMRAAKTRLLFVVGTHVYALDGKTAAAAVDQMRARCKL